MAASPSRRMTLRDDRGNRKLLFENFTDSYHTFHTHRDSINRYTPSAAT